MCAQCGSDPANVQAIPTGVLLQTYRDVLLALDTSDPAAVRRADMLEAEISRRMAW